MWRGGGSLGLNERGKEEVSHYILKDRKIVRASLLEWAQWFEHREHRVVAKSDVCGFRVSTIFLGMDSGHMWETMVFKGPILTFGDASDLDMDRCEGTFEQAEEMHLRMCDKIREAMGD